MTLKKDNYIYCAKIAEQASRYEEMIEEMKSFVKYNHNQELSMEDYGLFSLAYKKAIGSRRTAWRIMTSANYEKTAKFYQIHFERIGVYLAKIEEEMDRIVASIMELLDNYLIPRTSSEVLKVFYLKIKGDYHRYTAEYKTGTTRREAVECALYSYIRAEDISKISFKPYHPFRLGLVLNFSVFYYEICNLPERAFWLAAKAFDQAVMSRKNIKEPFPSNSVLIIQILKDNLILWTNNMHLEI